MREVITKYYCDRCGAEFRPYGKPVEITPGFGTIAFKKQTPYINTNTFKDAHDWTQDATDSCCAMVLCKECLDGLALYLMNE